jgi:hypothetical protein
MFLSFVGPSSKIMMIMKIIRKKRRRRRRRQECIWGTIRRKGGVRKGY